MNRTGYTLIETVVVLIIIGVLAAFIAPVLTESLAAYDSTSRNIEVLTKMRYAMDRMSREIRSMRRDPANSAIYDIVTGSMTATKLEYCKADGTRVTIDNAALASEVKLGYTAGFTSSCTASAATTQTLTDAVTTFCLSYCQIDGTTCTRTNTPAVCTATAAVVDETNVAFIDVTMTLTGTRTGAYANTMRVDLRNP